MRYFGLCSLSLIAKRLLHAADEVAEDEDEDEEEAEREKKKPGREVSFYCVDYPGLLDAVQLKIHLLIQGLKDRIQDRCRLFMLSQHSSSQRMALNLVDHLRDPFPLMQAFWPMNWSSQTAALSS